MNLNYQEKISKKYIIENGRVIDCELGRVVPGKKLYEDLQFDLLKKAFVSTGLYFHAYALDEIEVQVKEIEHGNLDLEYLHDTIIKLWLSNKQTTSIYNLIKLYINSPAQYEELYNNNIGKFLNYVEEVA